MRYAPLDSWTGIPSMVGHVVSDTGGLIPSLAGRTFFPFEQIWKEIRKRSFSNRLFSSTEQVVDRLCDSITSLSPEVISGITARD